MSERGRAVSMSQMVRDATAQRDAALSALRELLDAVSDDPEFGMSQEVASAHSRGRALLAASQGEEGT